MSNLLKKYEGYASSAFSNIHKIISFAKASEDLPVNVKHFMWSVMDYFEKELSKQKKKMRVALLDSAEMEGEEQENGSFVLELPHGRITKQKKVRKTLDPGGILELVNSKGLPSTSAGSFKFEPDETLLLDLINSGDITAEELSEHVVEGVTWALQVKKPDALVNMLTGDIDYGLEEG